MFKNDFCKEKQMEVFAGIGKRKEYLFVIREYHIHKDKLNIYILKVYFIYILRGVNLTGQGFFFKKINRRMFFFSITISLTITCQCSQPCIESNSNFLLPSFKIES